MEILLQFVLKHFMGLARLHSRLLGTDDGMQPQFRIHIFMDCHLAVAVPPAFQIDRHAAVSVYSIVAVVDLFNLFLDFRFLDVIIRLPVFPVVIVGVRADFQPSQQPANAEFFMILIDKSISL